MGTPRYLKVYLRSIICSVAVLAVTNSEPYVAVSTVAFFLEYQSVGVWLQKWRHAVRDAPGARQWRRLASSVVVVATDLPRSKAVVRDTFLNIAINCIGPVMLHAGKVAIVWYLSPVPG